MAKATLVQASVNTQDSDVYVQFQAVYTPTGMESFSPVRNDGLICVFTNLSINEINQLIIDSAKADCFAQTGYTISDDNDVLVSNFLSGINALIFNTPSRSLSTNGSNNTFRPSTTRNATVNYSIKFAFALTLLTSNGQVDLDYSLDNGATWINVATVNNAYSVAVTLSGSDTKILSGKIPANALVRLNRSQATNVTITIVSQQEVLE